MQPERHAASLGLSSVADATRITGVAQRQIRGWLQGYSQRRGKPAAAPILRRQHELRHGELALGFLDLLEVAFLGRIDRAVRRQGRTIGWKAPRAVARTAQARFGSDHPFAARRIHSDGRTIFLAAADETGDLALYDLVRNNFAIYDVLAASFIATVEYDDDQPRRRKPDDRFYRVVIDPRRAFGRPTEERSGVPTEPLFDASRAKAGNLDRVSAWYEVDHYGVDQAVHYVLGIGQGAPLAA